MGVPDRGLTWPDHGQNQGNVLIRLRVVFAPRCTPKTAQCTSLRKKLNCCVDFIADTPMESFSRYHVDVGIEPRRETLLDVREGDQVERSGFVVGDKVD